MIEESKNERNIARTLEKELRAKEQPVQFFPFTHGDHVERQREFLRQELKEELAAR